MNKFYKGLILIIMMFGHNYVLNQAQSIETEIQRIHSVNTTQFNLNMYSLPSFISIIFIIPLGILYDRYSLRILLIGAVSLLLGQTLVTFFGPTHTDHSFQLLVSGRVFQAIGAEVLYMIQGNLASTWMGRLAGMIFILPQCGQIANAFGTPFLNQTYNVGVALKMGLLACIFSFIACIFLWTHLKKQQRIIQLEKTIENLDTNSTETSSTRQHSNSKANRKSSDDIGCPHEQGREQENISEEHFSFKSERTTQKQEHYKQKPSIMKAGKVFWLTIALCAVNQCLYFPFLDNATVHIQTRFSIQYTRSGLYLCIPFISAIIITAIHGEYILHRFKRAKLMVFCSVIPVIGHLIILLAPNSQTQESLFVEIILVIGLASFGIGLGSYYSVSFPAVGYAVPQSIRGTNIHNICLGTAYACLCFFQTISMTIIPLISGSIIDNSKLPGKPDGTAQGYQTSSILFVILSIFAFGLSLIIYKYADSESYKYAQEQQQEQAEQSQKMHAKGKQDDSQNRSLSQTEINLPETV